MATFEDYYYYLHFTEEVNKSETKVTWLVVSG